MSLRHSPPAFTLIELLVSMAVLVLMTVSVVSMVNSVSKTTAADRRRLEADDEARRVFDRLAFDFAKMFKRADADSIFASLPTGGPTGGTGTNDKMFFYSEAPTYFDTLASVGANTPDPRGTAGLIGYRVPNNAASSANPWQLERLGKGLTWDGASVSSGGSGPGGVVFLTYPAASPSPAPTPTPFPASMLTGGLAGGGAFATTIGTAPNYDDGSDVDYHVLSSSVFRLEYCFALKNPTTTNQFAITHDQTKGFKDVAAIVVAIALLDSQSRALIPGAGTSQTADLSKIAAALPDPVFTGPPYKLMAELWNAQIKAPGFAASVNIPPTAAARIRVYQRYFYLNTPQ